MCESNVTCRCSSQLNHMKPETRVKKFQCDSCGRSFSQGYHLRRHQMIHTGERPFVCEICSRAFYRKDKLSRHRKIHMNPGGGSRNVNSTSQSTSNNTPSAGINMQAHMIPPIPSGMQLFPVHLDLAHPQWLALQQQQIQQHIQQQKQQASQSTLNASSNRANNINSTSSTTSS